MSSPLDFLTAPMNRNRLRFAITAVAGFVTLAVSFLTFESAMGPFWSAASVILVATLAYLLWPVLDSKARKQSEAAKSKAPKPVISSSTSTVFEAVCDPGPYDVKAGSPKKVPLNVQKGDRITGDVMEKDIYSFNLYIVDSENHVKFMNGVQNFKRAFKGERRGAYHVDKTIASGALWYAMLDAYGQQYVREITVNLERLKRVIE